MHPAPPAPPVRPRSRRRGPTALALGLGLVTAVLPAAPAWAHDSLRSTSPADGATVATAPDVVDLQMSSTPLGLGTQVQVTGPDGVVSTGDTSVVDTTVSQALGDRRPAGTYTVDWRVTSSDGHPVSGSFTFTATTATGGASASPSSSSSSSSSSSTGSSPATTPDSTTPAAATSPGGRTGAVVGLAVVVVAAAVLAALAVRRRRRR